MPALIKMGFIIILSFIQGHEKSPTYNEPLLKICCLGRRRLIGFACWDVLVYTVVFCFRTLGLYIGLRGIIGAISRYPHPSNFKNLFHYFETQMYFLSDSPWKNMPGSLPEFVFSVSIIYFYNEEKILCTTKKNSLLKYHFKL